MRPKSPDNPQNVMDIGDTNSDTTGDTSPASNEVAPGEINLATTPVTGDGKTLVSISDKGA